MSSAYIMRIMRYNLATSSNELATDLLTVWVRVFKLIIFCHVLPIVCKISIEVQGNGGRRRETSFAARNRFIWS